MTDIQKQALALINEVLNERYAANKGTAVSSKSYIEEALCRAIEQHEAFRQEVSNTVVGFSHRWGCDGRSHSDFTSRFNRFIITKPDPDPLVEVLDGIDVHQDLVSSQEYADALRAALEARGLEIREKGT